MQNTTRAISAILKDVVLDHVRVGKPYTPNFAEGSDVPQWSLMVTATEESQSYDAMLDLADAGLPVKADENGMLSLNLKQYVTTRNGKQNSINVVDAEYNELSEEERMTVGNGTKGHVAFYFYPYANASGAGMTARLTDVVVTEKVEYVPESREERMKRLFG